MKNITSTEMDGYVGKHISKVCGCSFINDGDNHCAHFVCHVMEYNFGVNCFAMSGKGERSKSANIRVQEVFAQCGRVGKWTDKTLDISKGFIFTTKASNVNLKKKIISNVPKKHIGIFIEQNVWQYKNKITQVIKQTPAEFKQHYTGTDFEIYYGEFPL